MLTKTLGGVERARAWRKAVGERIAAAPDEDAALRELVTAVAREIDPYAFGVFLESPGTHHLVLRHRYAHGPLQGQPITVRPEQGMVGFVYRHGVPLVVHDVATDPRYLRGPLADAVSALAVPIRSAGHVVGALDLEADVPWTFDDEDIDGLTALASAIGSVLARARHVPALP